MNISCSIKKQQQLLFKEQQFLQLKEMLPLLLFDIQPLVYMSVLTEYNHALKIQIINLGFRQYLCNLDVEKPYKLNIFNII